ncbi:uncharacterized protein LOC142575934 isoform X9 [Dermacentor variabilis]|uniref:uncharacterized protein LOC142575934 isoform X9 n=1 Tax=Dermacentor variabilis TaxID=34621 RepID=UPI003F5C48F5
MFLDADFGHSCSVCDGQLRRQIRHHKKQVVVQGDHADKQRTTCVLQSFLSWNAAGNFSWFGAKGKKFAKLHLCKLMYGGT